MRSIISTITQKQKLFRGDEKNSRQLRETLPASILAACGPSIRPQEDIKEFRIQKNILIIAATSKTVAQELFLWRAQILENFREFGSKEVTEIRIY